MTARVTRSATWILAVMASAALLAGCGDSSTEPDAPDYTGVYEGTTGRDLAVRMVVGSGNRVDSLSIRVKLSVGMGTCTGPLLLESPVAINGGSFSGTAAFPGSNITTSVTGTFSGSSVTGTHGGFSGSFSLTCGGMYAVGTGSLLSSGTWSVTKN